MPPLMKQEIHKSLLCRLSLLPADLDGVAIVQHELGSVKIQRMLHIDHYAPAALKKRLSSFSGSINTVRDWWVTSVLPNEVTT